MSASNDDSESVDQFLARIASLKDRHNREDEERTRKLEEEILQGRKERQARRAERARSISPSKESPSWSTSSASDSKRVSNRRIDPPVDFSPHSQQLTPSKPTSLRSRPESENPPKMSPQESHRYMAPPSPPSPAERQTPTSTTLARSGTLSWQQRPTSRDSNISRPRPLSGTTAATASPNVEETRSNFTHEPSRTEIAASLSTKDPTWFRQTSDRAMTSAAYRKHQIEDTSGDDVFTTHASMRLPGMGPDITKETVGQPMPQDDLRGVDIKSQGSHSIMETRLEDDTLPILRPTGSSSVVNPLAAKSQMRESPSENRSQAQLESDRPPSPTKGLGGFVQSAMMKRSDSVNKRWSVQANAGLKRGDSVASNRSTLAAAGASGFARAPSQSPTRASRITDSEPPSSPLTSSRPTSSHALDKTATEVPFAKQGEPSPLEQTTAQGFATAVSDKLEPEKPIPLDDNSLHTSPTKTSDTRRWSPTKASWLESALTRPESPRPTSLKAEQPAWKAEIQRTKAAKSSGQETSNSTSSYEVTTNTGLLRSPPLGGHTRPLSISGLPDGFSSGLVTKGEVTSLKPLEKASTETGGFGSGDVARAGSTLSAHNANTNAPPETSKDPSITMSKVSAVEPEKIKIAPQVKPKPQTPPKTDFRGNLKPRQTEVNQQTEAEPEFKAVFGKLKRTQTQNYVAPDELRDNITRGKAALTVSGGPQKTKRVDDFKESILHKKEAMRAASNAPQSKPGPRDFSKPEKSKELPEALARKKTLKQANTTIYVASEKSNEIDNAPSLNVPAKLWAPRKQERNGRDITGTASVETSNVTSSNFNANATSVADDANNSKTITSQESMETSKLAARLNPSLAGFLSRSASPKTVSLERLDSGNVSSSAQPTGTSFTREAENRPGGALSHMTKGRARGPKRRLPKSETLDARQDIEEQEPSIPPSESTKPANKSEDLKPPTSKLAVANAVAATARAKIVSDSWNGKTGVNVAPPANKIKAKPKSQPQESSPEETKVVSKDKPAVAAKSPELRKVSSPPPSTPTKPSPTAQKSIPPGEKGSNEIPSSAGKTLDAINVSRTTPIVSPLTPSTTKLNSPRSTRPLNDGGLDKSGGWRSTPRANAVGLGLEKPLVRRAEVVRPEPLVSPKKSNPETVSSRDEKSLLAEKLSKFFEHKPKARERADFDAQVIMQEPSPDGDKFKTLKMHIWEISGDGKKQSMPPQQEHILFEECMYLCIHSFEGANGHKSTDVYLWQGDGVANAAAEDAQLFCKKTAREYNAKLAIVKQGKEPPSFFQALGGILITRRTKSSSLYMLCGRRHLGHVTFDEVDFEADRLCSGFPYIVSAKFGKLYLWKGRGCCADELGAARLIGMDLGLTGEIEEVEEGREPSTFFDSFSNATAKRTPTSPDLWELKSDHEQYQCRLFRVEHDRPKSGGGFWGRRGSSPPKSSSKGLIQEISPYHQNDLDPQHIYLLDAYFELYVFVGDEAKARHAEFTTALHLAQDISILAPSLQDRPLMPSCHIIFGDPPKNFKDCFRKWRSTRTRPGLGGENMVIQLEEIFQAME